MGGHRKQANQRIRKQDNAKQIINDGTPIFSVNQKGKAIPDLAFQNQNIFRISVGYITLIASADIDPCAILGSPVNPSPPGLVETRN